MSTPTTGLRDAPWLAALALVTVFQVLRGTWTDVAIFAVALVLALSQTRASRSPKAALTTRAPARLVVVGAIVCGVVLVIAPRHGGLADVVVCAIGAASMAIALLGGWPLPSSGDAPTTGAAVSARAVRRSAVAWTLVAVVAGVWEATAYLTWKWGLLASGVMPAISDLLDPVLDTVVGKAVLVSAWLAGGVALLARAWAPTRAPTRGRDDSCT